MLIRTDVETPEPLKELCQVLDRGISEYFGFSVILTRQALGQVSDVEVERHFEGLGERELRF